MVNLCCARLKANEILERTPACGNMCRDVAPMQIAPSLSQAIQDMSPTLLSLGVGEAACQDYLARLDACGAAVPFPALV